MSGKDELRKTVAAIKGKKSVAVKEVANALGIPAEMESMYRESRDVGAENLGQSLPTLKIHYANQSKNELPDGKEPKNGWFFYSETQEQFEYVDCHILSISKGYRTEGYGGKGMQFQQLLSGIIIENDVPTKPFLMFVKGLSLSPMWEFGKAARKYTKGKFPIPLFALSVRISAVKEKTKAGNSVWVTKFDITRDQSNNPVIVTDAGRFTFLKDHVRSVEDTMNSIVNNKSSETELETQPFDFEEEMDALEVK